MSIGHVFIIVEENESYNVAFGPNSAAPYLSRTLPAQGALLQRYFGTGHNSLDNYISMISGQAPIPQTQSDCQFYSDFTVAMLDPNGQAVGSGGCVYTSNVPNLTGQLTAANKTWRFYAEDMGRDPARDGGTSCAHPTIPSADKTQSAAANDQYAARHVPALYFHDIIDNASVCARNVVSFNSLASDLASVATTPNYTFISPNLCNDGHDTNCANGDPGGLTQINTSLMSLVPMITSSPAFKDDGLLLIFFDEAATSDSTSCCGEIPGPLSAMPGITGSGGGNAGLVALSRYIKGGTVTMMPYNHYAMLRSVEDYFGLSHLGYANASGLAPFGPDVFTNPSGN